MRKFIQLCADSDTYDALADDGTIWRAGWDPITKQLTWTLIGTTPQQEVKP